MEFLIYVIYLFNMNNFYTRISRMAKQERITKNKNNSCLQFKKNNKIMNIDAIDGYKKKKIKYNSIKKENQSIQIEKVKNNKKNNFLFYTSNKDDIININDNMNFRFTNGINNLKEQKNYSTKEIKSYITKPKIEKYHSQYLNTYKELNNNIKNNKDNKSEICFNKEKSQINEKNKISWDKEQDSKMINNKLINY